jgi:hypothetical protein
MTLRQAALVIACPLVCLLVPPLRAAGPQFWRIEGSHAFQEGELDALAVDSLGRLRLGAAVRELHDLSAPSAWSLARDARGALYLGTGNEGRVVRVAGGKGGVLFDSDQLEVYAVAVSPDGRVYAATSPDGAVYAIDGSGQASRFFDPDDKYIWALAFGPRGELYVATGAEARVYRVERDGKAKVVLAAADTHILSLAVDGRGRLLAGSAPSGIVYRVGAEGTVSVLLDAPFREIRALDASEDGFVYAAAVDGRPPEAPRPSPPAAPAPAGATVVPEVTVTETIAVAPAPGVPQLAQAAAEAAAPSAVKGALLRISEAGDADTLWSSTEDVPYSVLRQADGVLVGTGSKGRLYRVTPDREWSLVASLPAEQVTALARGEGGETLAASANPARLYAIEDTLARCGSFVSKVKDAQAPSRWGEISVEGRIPPGAEVEVQARAGNTEQPDSTWSDWSPAVPAGAHRAPRPERARFLQLRVTLSGTSGATPLVEGVAVAYLQRNLPPDVKAITVHPPGEVFQKPISVTGDPEILGLDPEPLGDRADAARAAAGAPPAISFSRKMYQRGLRTLSWQAEDANNDGLLYEVQYRAVGDERWRTLRRNLSEPVFTWDTSTVPNGRYVIRVVASDAPDNPPGLALTGSADSASFAVDNTPPTISATVDGTRRNRIHAVVRDDSPVRKLEVSTDGGRWEEVHPRDGIADSSEEAFEITLPAPAGPGPRIVMLRATDILGNMATVRLDVP